MDPITPGIISNLITQAASVAGQRFFGGQIKVNEWPVEPPPSAMETFVRVRIAKMDS